MGIHRMTDVGRTRACGGVFFGMHLHAAAQGAVGFEDFLQRRIGSGVGGLNDFALKADAGGDVVEVGAGGER